MMNKDFLRQVLKDEKKLLKLSELKPINMPKYDELSVKNLYDKLKDKHKFMQYIPDKLPNGRLPDREYYFNVLNTVFPDYTKKLLSHANKQRMLTTDTGTEVNNIDVSNTWWEQLNELPFISCKYSITTKIVQKNVAELFICLKQVPSPFHKSWREKSIHFLMKTWFNFRTSLSQ